MLKIFIFITDLVYLDLGLGLMNILVGHWLPAFADGEKQIQKRINLIYVAQWSFIELIMFNALK